MHSYRPAFFYKLQNPHVTPTFKTETLLLLVMYSWLNGYLLRKERLIQHYLALFSTVTHDALRSLLRPHPSVISIASAII